jgi:hypothetical protein
MAHSEPPSMGHMPVPPRVHTRPSRAQQRQKNRNGPSEWRTACESEMRRFETLETAIDAPNLWLVSSSRNYSRPERTPEARYREIGDSHCTGAIARRLFHEPNVWGDTTTKTERLT